MLDCACEICVFCWGVLDWFWLLCRVVCWRLLSVFRGLRFGNAVWLAVVSSGFGC